MVWKLLDKSELEKFAEDNKAYAKEHAREIKKGTNDLCPYADIVKAWKRDYKKAVKDIIPVIGHGNFGETLTDVVYMVRTKDGETALSFANRSTMSGVDYASMRIGQAIAMIEKESRKAV